MTFSLVGLRNREKPRTDIQLKHSQQRHSTAMKNKRKKNVTHLHSIEETINSSRLFEMLWNEWWTLPIRPRTKKRNVQKINCRSSIAQVVHLATFELKLNAQLSPFAVAAVSSFGCFSTFHRWSFLMELSTKHSISSSVHAYHHHRHD